MSQSDSLKTSRHLHSVSHCQHLLLSVEKHFSNPLQSVLHSADLLAYVEDPLQHAELLRSIKYATRKVLRTTNQLAELVRFDRDAIEVVLEHTTLRSILHESIIRCREELHEIPSALIIDFPTADAVYELDRVRITDALAGLLIALHTALDSRFTFRLSCDPLEESSSVFTVHIAVLTPLDHQHRILWKNVLTPPRSDLTTDSLQQAHTAALLDYLDASIEFSDVPPTITLSFPISLGRLHQPDGDIAPSSEVFGGKRIVVFDAIDTDWSFLSESLEPVDCQLDIVAKPSQRWLEGPYEQPDLLVFRQPESIVPALTVARSLRSSIPDRLPVLLLLDSMTIDDLELSRSFADAVLLSPYTDADVLRYLEGLTRPDRRSEPRPIQLY